MKSIFLPAAVAVCIFVSCTKKDRLQDDPNKLIEITIEFDNVIGGQNLFLNSVNYTNASNEEFNISVLKYFVSNLKFRNTNGSDYAIPQDKSYFLINEADPESTVAHVSVPPGDYNELSFILGVDSARSTSDISELTGVLEPTTGEDAMYWDRNRGYIFFRLEGSSPVVPPNANNEKKFQYQIGGFGGFSSATINNIKTINLDLTRSGILQVRTNRSSNLHLLADILKIFDGVNRISIAAHPTVMFNDYSSTIPDNYSKMFTHDHTEN